MGSAATCGVPSPSKRRAAATRQPAASAARGPVPTLRREVLRLRLLLRLRGCQWSATRAQDRPIRCRAACRLALLCRPRRRTAKGRGLLMMGWPQAPLWRNVLLAAVLRRHTLWRRLRRPLRCRRDRRQQLRQLLQGRRQLEERRRQPRCRLLLLRRRLLLLLLRGLQQLLLLRRWLLHRHRRGRRSSHCSGHLQQGAAADQPAAAVCGPDRRASRRQQRSGQPLTGT